MYERAVVLSGKPGPLLDYMVYTNTVGLERTDGVLDVERAKVGYEMTLTMAKFRDAEDEIIFYEEALTEAGIDLAPMRAKADARSPE